MKKLILSFVLVFIVHITKAQTQKNTIDTIEAKEIMGDVMTNYIVVLWEEADVYITDMPEKLIPSYRIEGTFLYFMVSRKILGNNEVSYWQVDRSTDKLQQVSEDKYKGIKRPNYKIPIQI